MSIFTQAKELVSIEAFLGSVGIELVALGQGLRATCCPNPQCNETTAGSDRYRLSVRQGFWRCWSCNKSGDVVRAAHLFWGIPQIEAARRLVKTARTQAAVTVARTAVVSISVQQRAVEKVVAALFGYVGCSDEVRAALNARGLPNQVIDEAIAGGVLAGLPATPARAKLEIERYVGKNAMVEAGMWSEGAGYPATAFKPLLLRYGETAMECRRIDEPSGAAKEADQGDRGDRGDRGGARMLRYGATMAPFVLAGRSDEHVITKSAIDAMSLRTLGHQGTIIGLPGEGSWMKADDGSLPNARWFGHIQGSCQIAFKGSQSSDQMAQRLASALSGVGITAEIVPMPQGSDINDMLMSYMV